MSFILDSLRKSESARQQNVGPSIAEIKPSNNQQSSRSMFLWLGILLGINILVLLVSLWRPWQDTDQKTERRVTTNTTATASPNPQATSPRLVKPTAARPEVRPLASEVPAAKQETSQGSTPQPLSEQIVETPQAETSAPILERPGEILPTIHELQADGKLQLSNLHLDMHMYHEDPNRRFIFLNSTKYKEGERISEGPLLEEIRNDAVVFYYEGQRFLLPR